MSTCMTELKDIPCSNRFTKPGTSSWNDSAGELIQLTMLPPYCISPHRLTSRVRPSAALPSYAEASPRSYSQQSHHFGHPLPQSPSMLHQASS